MPTPLTAIGTASHANGTGGVGFGVAASYPAYAAPGFDFTRFLAFYKLSEGANTRARWRDLSGNGHDLLADSGQQFDLITSAVTGKLAYTTAGIPNPQACRWMSPDIISSTPDNYTLGLSFIPSRLTTAYLALLEDPNRSDNGRPYSYLVSSSGEPTLYQAGPGRGGDNSIPAGQRTTMRFTLDSTNGASVHVNGQLRYSGIAYVPTRILSLYLCNQSANAVLDGEHDGAYLFRGINPALAQEADAYLTT